MLIRLGGASLFLIGAALPAHADAIVVTRAMQASTIAEFFVEESGVRVELEIGLPDLPAFHNLMPDELRERMELEPEALERRLERFVQEDLIIRADGGRPLPGRVVSIEARPRVRRDEITGEPLPAKEDESEIVVFAVLDYPFAGHPAVLSLTPPRSESGHAVANIGFVLYHRKLPVTDFRYLGTESTVDLDWSDPWYSRFRNRNLRRQYDAPLNAFLYVEPYEVRVEVIARPVDLQEWIDLGLEERDTIPAEMQAGLRQRAAALLGEHIGLVVDGETVEPTLDRVHFLNRTLRTSTVIDPPRDLDLISATLGAIFVHPTTGYPEKVDLTWTLFTPRIERIPAAATDEAGPLPSFLAPDDNVLTWQNFLKNPTMPGLIEIAAPPPGLLRFVAWAGWLCAVILAVVVARGALALARGRGSRRQLALVAAGLVLVTLGSFAAMQGASVSDDHAGEIITALLRNVYHAFDYRDESAIYDMLERSVTGELLTQTYLETRRGLELASQGGARAKVKQVELLEVDSRRLSGGRGFSARCTWNVSGSVGHWGHIHQRTNQYQAELTVLPEAGGWKITDLQLLSEERL
jgi:hypothetical protein